MTKNTNIKIKFQQKCKTKNIPALLRADQNLVYTIKIEEVLKNLVKQSCWTISLDLTIYLDLPYISLTI